MTQKSILVLGGTGKTGRRVVSRLRAANQAVRAASRSGDVRFDWADRSTWDSAVSAVSAVYLVVPDEPVPVRDFVDQAVSSGVGRFVALSGRGVDLYGGESMLSAEQAVRDCGADWTILRPNWFNQNFDEDFFREPILSGELALPVGSAPEPFIDVEDIAEVAVAALTENGHSGRTYELSGPRALSFGAAVEMIAKASGRRTRFVDVPSEDFVTAQAANGVPVEVAKHLDGLFGKIREGHIAEPTDDVRRVLHRAPRDFEPYVARAAAAGAWA